MDKKELDRLYYLKNREKILKRVKDRYAEKGLEIKEYRNKYNAKTKDVRAEKSKIYYQEHKEIIKKRVRDRIKKSRWIKHYEMAQYRCKNPNSPDYLNYGGRGIRLIATKKDFKSVWVRDKAWKLKRPSIDRKDNDGNYSYENIRFIELSENSKRRTNKKGGKR